MLCPRAVVKVCSLRPQRDRSNCPHLTYDKENGAIQHQTSYELADIRNIFIPVLILLKQRTFTRQLLLSKLTLLDRTFLFMLLH